MNDKRFQDKPGYVWITSDKVPEKLKIDLDDSMINALRTLELANVSVIYFHMKTLPYPVNPIYYSMIYI